MSDGGPDDLGAVVERIATTEPRVEIVGDPSGLRVGAVAFDHRSVGRGDLFCCLVGEHADGHAYAAEARRRGAVAFVCEHRIDEAADGAVQVVVPPGRARPAMAQAACRVSGDPARLLHVVGVTGTNGKTTTTQLLGSIFAANGWGATVIGTLSGARTTPEAPDLQRQLAAAATSGSAAVAMEVTSHALVQHRVDGYVHEVAVFTNLSQDHLDYHHTMDDYFAAKALLFTPEHARLGVVNADDPWGLRLAELAPIPLRTFSVGDAERLDVGLDGSRFRLEGEEVSLRLAGELNVRNAVAAAAAARALGIDPATVAAGLSDASPVRGRFEAVPNVLGVGVVVDYAHTPDALRQALEVLRSMTPAGRLIVVFGAGGDRDRSKRPRMGSEASWLSDLAVVTSDNPRHENPLDIIEEIRAGWDGPAALEVEPNRRRAIAVALAAAGPGDVVLVAGKGHETSQQVGDEFLAFDDRAVVVEEAGRLAAELGAGAA